jgi:hypothetical protein
MYLFWCFSNLRRISEMLQCDINVLPWRTKSLVLYIKTWTEIISWVVLTDYDCRVTQIPLGHIPRNVLRLAHLHKKKVRMLIHQWCLRIFKNNRDMLHTWRTFGVEELLHIHSLLSELLSEICKACKICRQLTVGWFYGVKQPSYRLTQSVFEKDMFTLVDRVMWQLQNWFTHVVALLFVIDI